MTEKRTFGQRYDEISARMDAAYAARRNAEPGTAEYVEADNAIEEVYFDLRHLNAEVKGR